MKQYKEILITLLLVFGLLALVTLGFILEILFAILLTLLFGLEVTNWLLLILLFDLGLGFFFYNKLFAPESEASRSTWDDDYDSWHD